MKPKNFAPLRESFFKIFSRKAAKEDKHFVFLDLKACLPWRLGGEKLICPGRYFKFPLTQLPWMNTALTDEAVYPSSPHDSEAEG